MTNRSQLKIGLALGSGSARGWAHIGVIRALAELGIAPDIVCGCSIGSIVGAAYAAGNLDGFENWVCSLTRMEVARFIDVNLSLRGFVDAPRLHNFLHQHVCHEDRSIESLHLPFATVATELHTGREVWSTEGPVLDAVWASISLPGLFPPIKKQGRWMVDGGLVNPVPVSLCRALGADIVIAVNLNGDLMSRHLVQPSVMPSTESPPAEIAEMAQVNLFQSLKNKMWEYSTNFLNGDKDDVPSLFDAITGSVHIIQDRITRSRMAGDPPDVLLNPKLSHIGLLEFYRASEAVEEGRKCVTRLASEIQYVLNITPS